MTSLNINTKHQKEDKSIKIKKKVEFEFAYEENAQRVALALCSAGYFVKITTDTPLSVVHVYTYDNL